MSRKRNYVAKKLREDPRFRPKRIERKRRKDDDGDYDLLDLWLGRSTYQDNVEDKERSDSF